MPRAATVSHVMMVAYIGLCCRRRGTFWKTGTTQFASFLVFLHKMHGAAPNPEARTAALFMRMQVSLSVAVARMIFSTQFTTIISFYSFSYIYSLFELVNLNLRK